MAQTVIITGATSGLGLLTARRLAAAGWRVIATGRNLAGLTASDREAGIEPVVLNLDALATVDDFVRWLDSAGVERLDAWSATPVDKAVSGSSAPTASSGRSRSTTWRRWPWSIDSSPGCGTVAGWS